MTADERALLAAVCADPGGDLPRLVYADWLDDHGRPERAAYIRLSCELPRATAGDRREWLLSGLRVLVGTHGGRCHADLPAAGGVWWGVHVRGFPERLTVDISEQPVGKLPRLLAGVPVTTLTVHQAGRAAVVGRPLRRVLPAWVRTVSLDGVTMRPVRDL